jgi:hypothetical protein
LKLPDLRAVVSFARRLNPKAWAAILALLVFAALVVFYISGEIKGVVQNLRSKAADARSEQIVKQETDAAAAHEANANDAAVTRQISEARANDAQAEKVRAAANSNQTAEPTARARQRYEKTRRTPVAPDAADMSDSELCAELSRRGIATPGCQ